METKFTAEQLSQPRIAEADDILRKCVHCGLCTASCPTYVLRGDERDSPRGRIYLIKGMLESGEGADRDVSRHVDRCLSCLTCMTACPSDVDYMHLVDLARAHIEETSKRPARERLLRQMLARVLPDARVFRRAMWAGVAAQPFKGLLRKIGLADIAHMLDLSGGQLPRRGRYASAETVAPEGETKGRVALLAGCVQSALRPEITDAAARVLSSQGYEVTMAEGQGCCGALNHHLGLVDEAEVQAKANVDAFSAAMRHAPLDAIVVTGSGCGTMMKDYTHIMTRDQAYTKRAARVANLTKDISEFLAGIEIAPPLRWSDLRVAYHDACSLRNGQGIEAEPRALLARVGYRVVDVGEQHLCCGSAGTYNILQSEFSGELRDRKVGNIAATGADVVATGNIGCITQLQKASPLPVVHTVELVDWALGGPIPAGMKKLASRARDIKG